MCTQSVLFAQFASTRVYLKEARCSSSISLEDMEKSSCRVISNIKLPIDVKEIDVFGEKECDVEILGIQELDDATKWRWAAQKLENGVRMIKSSEANSIEVKGNNIHDVLVAMGVNPRGDARCADYTRTQLEVCTDSEGRKSNPLEPPIQYRANASLHSGAVTLSVFIRSFLDVFSARYTEQMCRSDQVTPLTFMTVHPFEELAEHYISMDGLPVEASFGWLKPTTVWTGDTRIPARYRVALEGITYKADELYILYESVATVASKMLAHVSRVLLANGTVCDPSQIDFRVALTLCHPYRRGCDPTPAFAVLWNIPARRYNPPPGEVPCTSPDLWVATVAIARLAAARSYYLPPSTQETTIPLFTSLSCDSWKYMLLGGVFMGTIFGDRRASNRFSELNKKDKKHQCVNRIESCDLNSEYYASNCAPVRLCFGLSIHRFEDSMPRVFDLKYSEYGEATRKRCMDPVENDQRYVDLEQPTHRARADEDKGTMYYLVSSTDVHHVHDFMDVD